MGLLIGYLVIGLVLGWAWNRVEFRRSGVSGTGASFAVFLLAWPLVALYALAVAAIWSRLFERTYRSDEPQPASPATGAFPPDPPALTGPAAAH